MKRKLGSIHLAWIGAGGATEIPVVLLRQQATENAISIEQPVEIWKVDPYSLNAVGFRIRISELGGISDYTANCIGLREVS